MKYRLVIFDLDGTILDTLDDLADSTNYALEINQCPARTRDEVRRFVGNGIGKLIERAVPEGTSPEKTGKVLQDFKTHYGVHCADKTKAYDGIMELLTKLKECKLSLAVVSNKADFAVQELCNQYFPGIFDFVVGEREHIRRKPAPDTVLEVLEQLQMEKETAVYVGDSEVDIQTAVNAGMDVISVTWGFRDSEELRAQGAQIVVNRPADILAQLGIS